MRPIVCAVLVLGLAAMPALAASSSASSSKRPAAAATTTTPLAPGGIAPVINNYLGLDASSSLPTPETAGSDASTISQDIFAKRDDAYGAFQRGYYLTALALALPRAEKADPAAQTLIATVEPIEDAQRRMRQLRGVQQPPEEGLAF